MCAKIKREKKKNPSILARPASRQPAIMCHKQQVRTKGGQKYIFTRVTMKLTRLANTYYSFTVLQKEDYAKTSNGHNKEGRI